MSDYNAGTNPSTVMARVKYRQQKDILKVSEAWYNGFKLTYTASMSGGTTISLTAVDNEVSTIKTTKVDSTTPNTVWTGPSSSYVWTYTLPASVMDTNQHTVDFTVTWKDGTTHDPQIIINPSNGTGDV